MELMPRDYLALLFLNACRYQHKFAVKNHVKYQIIFRLTYKSPIINYHTINVRTLHTICQQSELIESAINQLTDIICIQEHRYFHGEVILKYHEMGKNWTLITASSWKNSSNSTIGGVGMLLSSHTLKSLLNIEKISPRIVVATFNGNPQTTIISCYSPTNVSEEQDVLHFYNELASLVRAVPRHNMLIIAGDMNAQLGRNQHHKHAFHAETDRNGKHFNHFLTENNLYCLNTRFQKKRGKLWTHTYPNSVKAQLDYISVYDYINSVQNCEAYNSFEGVSSDHRIVSIKVQLSLRANKKKSSIKLPFDWKQLSSNADIRNKFTITLQNCFSQLQNEDNDNINPNNTYINFMNAHKQAAEDCIPLKHKTKHKVPWENEIVEQKRECLKMLANLKNKTPTSTNIRNYRKARQELEETYNIEQHKYIQEQIETIRNAAENKQSSLAWQTVNEVTGRKRSTQAKLKASTQDERLQKWKEHFQNLLGKAPVIKDQPIQQIIDNQLPIKKGPFSEEELETVQKKLKNKKAPGLDEIPPEVWKTRRFNDILLKSCNSLYNQSSIQIWTEGCIPSQKKVTSH